MVQPFKQGSSENDGRSDDYDRSEFRVFLTAVTTTAVAPIAVIFTCIYLNIPKIT